MALHRLLILEILRAELKSGTDRHRLSQRAFSDAMAEARDGLIPHPDGTLLVQRAAREEAEALTARCEALARYADFVVRDIVPNVLPNILPKEPVTSALWPEEQPPPTE